MSGSPTYVIRRKVTRIKPSPIPETTYTAETFPQVSPAKPIRLASPHCVGLAKPKEDPYRDPPLTPIPHYQSPALELGSVDVRANRALLYRDLHLIHEQNEKAATEKANEPVKFNAWQKQMQDLDEQQRMEIIQQRHADLNFVRRRAAKVRKQQIAERLAMGKQMRVKFGKEITQVQEEIESERRHIRQLKQQLNTPPQAVAKAQRARITATRRFRREMRAEFREEQRRRELAVEEVKKRAGVVRQQVQDHVLSHGDPYSSKLEITKTTFLTALSDEETKGLLERHARERKQQLEEEIEEHRRIKMHKMETLVQMLEEATTARNVRADEKAQQRRAKKEEAERLRQQREREDEDKMLLLEKKLERKRRARIKEVQEMEEHIRQIAARNRYLALNKNAVATRVFQSQQDAKLREARERQENRMPEDQIKIPPAKVSESIEMSNLRRLLGVASE
jgi:hypothetical protein